jgi:hypothetical protein
MRFFGTLFFVVLVIALLGWWRGWFFVEAANTGHRTETRLTIDRERISDDAADAAAKVEALTDRAVAVFKSRSKAATTRADGIEVAATLVAVNEPARTVQLRVGDEVFTAGVGRDVGITIAGQNATIGQLRTGAEVTLHMTPTDAGKSLRIRNITQ